MTEGYQVRQYGQPVKRYCQTMELKDEPALIVRYRQAHSKDEAWQEILDGIRQVGILEMEIYIKDNRLVMIVETPEWEAFVAQFQQCDASATSDEKWQMMERMFYLYDR